MHTITSTNFQQIQVSELKRSFLYFVWDFYEKTDEYICKKWISSIKPPKTALSLPVYVALFFRTIHPLIQPVLTLPESVPAPEPAKSEPRKYPITKKCPACSGTDHQKIYSKK